MALLDVVLLRRGVHGYCRGRRRRRHHPGAMVSVCSNWQLGGGGFPGSVTGRYSGTGIL